MRIQNLATVAAGVLLALAGPAQAAQKQSNFQVTATVLENCTISATDLAFGNWLGDTDVASQSTITVRCTLNTDYAVNLSGGSTSGDPLDRQMTSGGPVNIHYNLYTDAAHQQLWSDGSNNTFNQKGTGAGMNQSDSFVVHGRIRAADNTAAFEAGGYADTVTATVVY
jgi:spore coat protein U-like protein